MSRIREETLLHVTGKLLNAAILCADFQVKELHGGTLGDVKLVTGTATLADGSSRPYKVVWKTQRKWERYQDPGSWRREYDLYRSGLGAAFSDALRWPECYLAELNAAEDEIQLWMEYIDGVSGLDLTGGMCERAAYELGRFQGGLYAKPPDDLRDVPNLSCVDSMKRSYLHYRSWPFVYEYIRSDGCEIPKRLRDMLIRLDENADAVFSRIEKLPVVLCHRDFWVANIFYADGNIRLIDWDTAGWGYFGEDIASLIADEADVPRMAELYRRCVPAYYKGFREYAAVSQTPEDCVWEMTLLLFGYRLVEWLRNAETPEDRRRQIDTLRQIDEMRGQSLWI